MKPIFVDVNAHATDYDHLPDDELLVSSIFKTIQGEGPFAGKRCVFLRMAGCNLGGKGVEGPGCNFCDTDFRLHEGFRLSFREIYDTIDELLPERSGSRLIVVTGGEPMLQNNLVGFLKFFHTHKYKYQIESNGTRLLRIPPTNVYLVVSPKIPMVLNADPSSYSHHTLSKRVLGRADCLKFVVSDNPESPYHRIPGYAFDFHYTTGKPVYVSPMAVYRRETEQDEVANIWDSTLIDIPATMANHAYACRIAMEHGLMVSVQMQLYLGVR